MRALRVDKLTLSSLEIILREYYLKDEKELLASIPVLKKLTESSDNLEQKGKIFNNFKSKRQVEFKNY